MPYRGGQCSDRQTAVAVEVRARRSEKGGVLNALADAGDYAVGGHVEPTHCHCLKRGGHRKQDQAGQDHVLATPAVGQVAGGNARQAHAEGENRCEKPDLAAGDPECLADVGQDDREDLPIHGIKEVRKIKDQQDGQPIPDSRSGELRDGWSGRLGGWPHDGLLGLLGRVAADVAVKRM